MRSVAQDKYFRKLRVVWVIILLSIVMYALVTTLTYYNDMKLADLNDGELKLFEIVAVISAAAIIGIIIFLGGIMKSPERIQLHLKKLETTKEKASANDQNNSAANMLLPYYFQICMIRWTLVDFAAIYGLLLTLIGGSVAVISLLYIFSFATLIKYRAYEEELDAMAQTARRK